MPSEFLCTEKRGSCSIPGTGALRVRKGLGEASHRKWKVYEPRGETQQAIHIGGEKGG